MAHPSKLYLLSYNSLQSLGWFIALLRLLPCLAPPLSIHSAYAVAGELICFLQTCAVLETVHAAIGLVPTSPLLAFLQWGGRTHFALAVVRQIPEVQSSPSVFITFIAWSISEVIRYSHYALTTLKVCPAWLIYLRFDQMVHCFYPTVSDRGRTRRNVDYLPSSSLREGDEYLLKFLREVLHELSFLSSGWAGMLSVSLAEALPAHVQATQVEAGKGGQEETSLRKI